MNSINPTRRQILVTATAAGTITLLPFSANFAGAASHGANTFSSKGGNVTMHPVRHASFVMETPVGTIYVDPVGDVSAYAAFPDPDLILVTHHHGDHFKPDVLAEIVGDDTKLITNPTVFGKLPDGLKARASEIANGGHATFKGLKIDAIGAYNLTAERSKFHPKGRDNGYVLSFDGLRVYISGDTEDIPDMRALKDIDVAFVCMNLPFTMDAKAAASAVAEFKPKYVYPYHYRGRDGGTQDPAKFAEMVGDDVKVNIAPWYG